MEYWRPLDVLAVADCGDAHWNAVERELLKAKSTVLRFNLSDIRSLRFTVDLDRLLISTNNDNYATSSRSSAWWRYAGIISTVDLDSHEARLAYDEGPHLLIGGLDAASVRMVSHPYVIAKAEVKLSQLALAKKLGIKIPATLVTNNPDAARQFALNERVVAKAVSSGIGIAPFVAEVKRDELESVKILPTMLQKLVPATADLRVVVVGNQSWVWRRPREERTVDWRQADPTGRAFAVTGNADVGFLAAKIAEKLSLGISVQDWLDTGDGPVFLESNALGAWLFLAESERCVAPAIARYLRNEE
jgi:hypothetical protein